MSVHSFIAHFLKENGYPETLKSFEKEHGSPISTELPHEEPLTEIITDRMKFLTTKPEPERHDQWLDKELLDIKQSQFKAWSAPYPEKSEKLASLTELVVDAAVLDYSGRLYLLGGTSGRNLVVFDLSTGEKVLECLDVIGKVVIRRIVVTQQNVLLCGMNGKVYFGKFNSITDFTVVSEFQIHSRLITDVKVVQWRDSQYLVSMGWDFLVKVFKITPDGLVEQGEPYKLTNQGTCLDACVYNDSIYIAVGKSEITLMEVVRFDSSGLRLDCRIALNDAEFSASGFTPMCIRIFLDGPVPLVAVGTSHEPYMRVVLVTLKDVGGETPEIKRNQIIANINTMSPQDKYSQASIAWRYDGSGLWVMGEDGTVRGLDLCKEKIVVELLEHDGRIKSSVVYKDTVITCGTDRRILKWVY